MNDNSGGTLKDIAMALGLLEIVASIVVGLMLIIEARTYYRSSGLGFAVLIGGCFIGYFSNLLIYAFGELVENSQRQNELLVQIYGEQKATNKRLPNLQQTSKTKDVVEEIEDSKNVSDYLPEL